MVIFILKIELLLFIMFILISFGLLVTMLASNCLNGRQGMFNFQISNIIDGHIKT
jgi:hypothetical protein